MRPGDTRHSIASIASIASSLPRGRGCASLPCKARGTGSMSKRRKGAETMSFSYNAVWEDAVRLLRQHAPLLAAIAGVFLFLPALLFAVFLPQPTPPQGGDP